jgi:DNA-binding MarR family transcriptional regulator
MTGGSGFKDLPHLIGLVALVGRLAQEQVAAALSPLGVTYAQAVALVRLWMVEGERMLQRDLIESLGISRASGSEVLNQLERLGLIERVWDAADSRNRLVGLTPQGRELEGPVLRVFDEVEEGLRDGGGPEQVEAAFATLRSMLENARRARRDANGGRA